MIFEHLKNFANNMMKAHSAPVKVKHALMPSLIFSHFE